MAVAPMYDATPAVAVVQVRKQRGLRPACHASNASGRTICSAIGISVVVMAVSAMCCHDGGKSGTCLLGEFPGDFVGDLAIGRGDSHAAGELFAPPGAPHEKHHSVAAFVSRYRPRKRIRPAAMPGQGIDPRMISSASP